MQCLLTEGHLPAKAGEGAFCRELYQPDAGGRGRIKGFHEKTIKHAVRYLGKQLSGPGRRERGGL